MKQRRSGIAPIKAGVLAMAAALALATFGPGLAPAATVYMKDVRGKPRFVSPQSVTVGEELEIVNQSNPRKAGPHTFSLVTRSLLPKTPKERATCFSKNGICLAIARWHGTNGNSPVTKNPVKAGGAGWDTTGSSVKAKGDSWYTGEKPGTSFSQELTLDVSGGSERLYYLCAIHPFMQGSTAVRPATG